MPPQSQSQLDPNKVSVGLAQTNNFLQQHLQSQMPQEEPAQDPAQGIPQNQTNPEDTKAQMDGLESRLMDELQTLKAEMKNQSDGKKELADFKDEIMKILQSND